jgi:Asp-tRNA(Asn)/Glu-tRNA(Gln) amidotransferase C subunit
MATVEQLEQIAALAGLRIARSDLERLLPFLDALYADLERLSALPIAGLEPAFTPRRWEESRAR